MLSIQDAGKQILTGNPGKFYVFVGEEYGIKEKYLTTLKSHYGAYTEVDSVDEILKFMGNKHLIPLQPKLYISRYDEGFIQSLNDSTSKKIDSLNIIGTLICVYQSSKHTTKCAKYLPDYTISFDAVNSLFVKKYLRSDFPNMSDNLIDFAVRTRNDYKGAWNICNSLSRISIPINCREKELSMMFGCSNSSTDNQLRAGIASRNFAYTLSILENYSDDIDSVFYTILNTLIELDKLIDNKMTQSDLREYAKAWTAQDIYNMFMNTYSELKKVRSYSSYKPINSLIYLLGLMQFSPIPSLEVMSCN